MIGVFYHEKEKCDVYVTSGEHEVNGRVSNYYTYYIINKSGKLGEKKGGYGNLSPTKNEYEIIFKLKDKKCHQ